MHGITNHPLDPNFLDFEQADREWRIYADDRAQTYALVDREDYETFSRWLWVLKRSRGTIGKVYLRRAIGFNQGKHRLRTVTAYLHVEIMHANGIKPLSEWHTIVDHRNGNSLDCRKENLRWVTPRMNCLNRHGRRPRDFFDDPRRTDPALFPRPDAGA